MQTLRDYYPISGVYKITSMSTGRVYIGQTKWILKRLTEHVSRLVDKQHTCSQLQKDFNTFGLADFTVEILTECTVDQLRAEETRAIRHYDRKGYQLYTHR